MRRDDFDVIVVGGGPAGSVMAWSLARRGVTVAVVERETFPREKVCGDFVEPGGLRILEAMGCLGELDAPAPITATRVYFGSRLAYQGAIPYYEAAHGAPAHGHIVPRHRLDTLLLAGAEAAGATVFQGASAGAISREDGKVTVAAKSGEGAFTLCARLIVGADGAESTVARQFGQRRTDRRYIAISQRAYVEDARVEEGEAAIWFDEDLYPGYGWMFPMSDGRANLGVGIGAEPCHRHGLSVPKAFAAFIEKLRLRHPGCANVRLASRPLGGVVKTYGGIGANHFDGGILIGDAGSFVDPMTGEGITQGMESALIGASTISEALERGRFDAAFLARYDREFRAWFDPSMLFLDLVAAMMRNWHFREFWLRATARGFGEARADPAFARLAGASFGGLDVRPLSIVQEVWRRIFAYLGGGGAIGDLLGGRAKFPAGVVGDFAAWERGWRTSLRADPAWHMAWLADVAGKAVRLQPTLWTSSSPRLRGPDLQRTM